MVDTCYFRLLGFKNNSEFNLELAKKRHKKLALIIHPDKVDLDSYRKGANNSKATKEQVYDMATLAMSCVNIAKECLWDVDRRKYYAAKGIDRGTSHDCREMKRSFVWIKAMERILKEDLGGSRMKSGHNKQQHDNTDDDTRSSTHSGQQKRQQYQYYEQQRHDQQRQSSSSWSSWSYNHQDNSNKNCNSNKKSNNLRVKRGRLIEILDHRNRPLGMTFDCTWQGNDTQQVLRYNEKLDYLIDKYPSEIEAYLSRLYDSNKRKHDGFMRCCRNIHDLIEQSKRMNEVQ